jgi:acyl carrier protein
MANSISEGLEPRVIKVVQSMFKVPASVTDGSSLRMGEVTGWDSMGHMRLVNELEDVFGVTFPTYMLAEITDVPGIARAIDSLGGR